MVLCKRRFIINFVLLFGSLPFLAVVTWWIRPTNYGQEKSSPPGTASEKSVGEPDNKGGSPVDEGRSATEVLAPV